MTAYYNEINPYAAQWLRNLIEAGMIAPGDVDERDIREVQPADVAGYEQVHLFAGIGVWSYALRLAGWGDARPVWTASCPCFPAGTLVITSEGYKPIEGIVKGDMVLTHRGRFRRVLQIGSEMANCVRVKGQGHHGIVCTPDHPFLVGDDEWADAQDLKGQRWATVASMPPVPMPELPRRQRGFVFDKSVGKFRTSGETNGRQVYLGVFDTPEKAILARRYAIVKKRISVRGADAVDATTTEFARFLGYWLGDGWVSRDTVFLCGARGECDLLDRLFSEAGLRGKSYIERTSSRIRCGSKFLSKWLTTNFGRYAHGKKIPVWLHGMPEEYRSTFLEGYKMADGHTEIQSKGGGRVTAFTTVSKAVAIGVCVLLNQAGISASIRRASRNRTAVIEGRKVNERPTFKVTAYETARSFRFDNGRGWGVVRSVEPVGSHRVYNVAVEEDESYTADGIIVHNCPPFSSAGKQFRCPVCGTRSPVPNAVRTGAFDCIRCGHEWQADERHLWPEVFRLRRHYPDVPLFGEQVASADGIVWLDLVRASLEMVGNAVRHEVSPACSVGAPHIRHRVYFAAVALGDSKRAGLEGHSRHGDDGHKPGWVGSKPGGSIAASSAVGRLADAHGWDARPERQQRGGEQRQQPEDCGARGLADATRGRTYAAEQRRRLHGAEQTGHDHRPGPTDGFWRDADWLGCRDGKWRPVEPGTFPLADGAAFRMGSGSPLEGKSRKEMLKGYGNAIVAEHAAAFIRETMEDL